MADNACGFAMSTHGFVAVTVNSTFNFMRGAQVGDHLTAEAVEVKGGKTISVYEARVTNQNGDLIASGTFTFFRMEKQLVFPF
jgi:acyl-CoA thioesterase